MRSALKKYIAPLLCLCLLLALCACGEHPAKEPKVSAPGSRGRVRRAGGQLL